MLKKLALIFIPSYIINVLVIFFLFINVQLPIIQTVFYSLIAPILIFLIFFICYSPIILLVCYLIKKQIRKAAIIGTIALTIPFYTITTITITLGTIEFSDIIISCILFEIFTVMIISLVIPKSILPEKKDIALTSFITILTYLIFTYTFNTYIYNRIENYHRQQAVKSFEPIVKYIEDYKQNNGTYPQDTIELDKYIKNTLSNNHYKNNYEYYLNGEDFILLFHSKLFYKYQYCSNKRDCNGTPIKGNWYYKYDH